MQSVSKATKTVFTKQGRTLPCFLYDSLVSTNDEAKRIIREGGEDCFAVCALEQTGGRGRYSRPFLSLRGKGLYITFAIRADEIGAPHFSGISPPTRDGNGDFSPEALAVRCATFGALSSLAVAALLEELFGVVAEFKWPNDVLACRVQVAKRCARVRQENRGHTLRKRGGQRRQKIRHGRHGRQSLLHRRGFRETPRHRNIGGFMCKKVQIKPSSTRRSGSRSCAPVLPRLFTTRTMSGCGARGLSRWAGAYGSRATIPRPARASPRASAGIVRSSSVATTARSPSVGGKWSRSRHDNSPASERLAIVFFSK